MDKLKLPAEKQDLCRKVAGWSGLLCTCCAGVLFILRLLSVYAFIEWPSNFLADVNKANWRAPLFSFAPDVFVDVWTPFLFFYYGLAVHIATVPYGFQRTLKIGESFQRFFAFHLIMAFFGGIGYGGDIGIIFGAIQFACATVIFILMFLCDGEPALKLEAKFALKAAAENDSTKIFGKVTGWVSLVAGILVVILGFFRICGSGAKLAWIPAALQDQNKQHWRVPLFTFTPDNFADAWTPLAMGVLACACHLKATSKSVEFLHKSHLRLFIYYVVMGLFGTIGYMGGLGIIFSAFVFLAALFQLIAIFIARGQSIILDLEVGGSMRISGEGVNAEAKV